MESIEALVTDGTRKFGRFTNRPPNLNPGAQFPGARGAWRRSRLKEWLGFTLAHPDIYSSLIIQDAKYIASSEMYVYDRSARVLHQHDATGRAGRQDIAVDLYGSNPTFAAKRYRVEYEFGASDGTHSIFVDIARTDHAPAFRAELTLYGVRASPPLSISAKLPGGSMYTHKVAFPAEGTLQFGTTEVRFDASRDLAILDEHKSFLPYRTNWLWGTFCLHVDGGLAGANLAERPSVPGEEDESCLWTPSAAEPLSHVSFEPAGDPHADPSVPWHIRSADGRVDVTFEPEGRKTVKHQLVLAAIDYFQMFGHYRGTLRGAHGTYEFVGIHGVCESMKARL